MIALVDGNNFFASCERVFNPSLQNKPVLVLSNNDGCVVARSNEVKKLGIRMGTPYFKIENEIIKYEIEVFSSNLSLYGDMSDRMMSVFGNFACDFEIYSVDECFLDLSGFEKYNNLREYGGKIINATRKNIGIPASIGIAETKTLAKVASKYAKKYPQYKGVCVIDSEEKREKALKKFDVADIWGIGGQYAKFLESNDVKTAYDFIQKPMGWVRRNMHVMGERIWKELRGIPCYGIDTNPSRKKNICTSRSFGTTVKEIRVLNEAVANFAASCARKLRKENSCASMVTVFLLTNRFRNDLPQHFESKTITLTVPSNASGEVIAAARSALKLIFREGYEYKKAGVIVSQIIPANEIQLALWDDVDRLRLQRLYNLADKINTRNGLNTLRMAAQGYGKKWHLKTEHCSAQYTTNWNELIEIN